MIRRFTPSACPPPSRRSCRKQAELGIDVINDGEYGKASFGAIDYGAWSSYAWGRLSGWEPGEPGRLPALAGRRDRARFAEFYAELDATGFRSSSSLGGRPPVFTGPIAYVGQQAVRADLANFKAALAKVTAQEGFITAVAPGSFARRQNRYYGSDEAFLEALAEALREEYKAIIEAGFVLQLDDPGLPDTWDMANPEPSVADYQKFAMLRVEALNHALRDLPEDRIRYHICWGSWHGPHTTDLPLKDIVDVLLQVRAGAFSIEAGNVRHEHEWKVWRDVKLPEGSVLIPGVVGHATNFIEHPEVVADRILNFAGSRGARMSLPVRIVVSAAGSIRNSSGPSSKRSSPAPNSRPMNCGRETWLSVRWAGTIHGATIELTSLRCSSR